MTEPAIVAEGVAHHFGAIAAVDGLSVDAEPSIAHPARAAYDYFLFPEASSFNMPSRSRQT